MNRLISIHLPNWQTISENPMPRTNCKRWKNTQRSGNNWKVTSRHWSLSHLDGCVTNNSLRESVPTYKHLAGSRKSSLWTYSKYPSGISGVPFSPNSIHSRSTLIWNIPTDICKKFIQVHESTLFSLLTPFKALVIYLIISFNYISILSVIIVLICFKSCILLSFAFIS